MEFLQVEVNQQNYLINTDSVIELLQYREPTPRATSSDYIKGIINYKDKILPIVNIRRLLGFQSYKDAQIALIHKVEQQHIAWVKEFENSLITGDKFTKALDPHKCELGKWIDKTVACLRCNNNGFVDILSKEVIDQHAALHDNGRIFLQRDEGDKKEKVKVIKKNAEDTIKGLHILESKIDKLTSVFEQIVIMNVDGIEFGLVVDRIDKTHELQEKNFLTSTNNISRESKYIQFINHYDIKGKLMFSMKFTDEFKKILNHNI